MFIQEQNEIRTDYVEVRQEKSEFVSVIRSRAIRGLAFVTVFAIVIPVLMYFFIIDEGTYQGLEFHTCAVQEGYQISCGRPNATFSYCTSISCCFDNDTSSCYHYIPSRYSFKNNSETGTFTPSLTTTPFGNQSLKHISLTVFEIDENSLRFTLHETGVEIPEQIINQKNYQYESSNDSVTMEIYRNDEEKDLLLTTSKGPLIVSDDYWEWSFHLTNESLFGLGETLIKVNTSLTKVIYPNRNDHNSLPVFMAFKNGKYHGAKIRHSGPIELTVLRSNLVTIKTLIGDRIEVEVCVGPTVKDVMKQQREDVFKTKNFDPWLLGIHNCREGNSTKLADIAGEFQGFNGTNFDSDCVHENLLIAWELSKDQTLKDSLIESLQGITLLLSLSPHVLLTSDLYDKYQSLDLFYKNITKEGDYNGTYLSNEVAFPDFNHESNKDFISDLIQQTETNLQIKINKLLLGNNWPVDETPQDNENEEEFQYLSKYLRRAFELTLPWYTLTSKNLSHLITHNDYGSLQVKNFASLLEKDSFIMTSSHNLDLSYPVVVQDVDISWTNLKRTIRQILFNSIFVNPLTSTPICGSTNVYDPKIQESLCMRWYLMAATQPFFRISSDIPRRDPDSLYSKTATNTANHAINLRKSLQLYFRTVLNEGEPLMRPMFYDFPDDEETFGLVDQYMVGESLLVAHPLLPDKKELRIYLPSSVNVWYYFSNGVPYDLTTRDNGIVALSIVETDWIAFIPEGKILPLINHEEDDSDSLKLIIALKSNGENSEATGTLLDCFSLTATEELLTVTKLKEDFEERFDLTNIKVYSDNPKYHMEFDLTDHILDKTTSEVSYPYPTSL